MIPNVHKRQRPTPVFKSQKDAPPARSALRIQANRICVRVGFSMFWLLSRTTLSAAGLLLPIRDLTSLNGEKCSEGCRPANQRSVQVPSRGGNDKQHLIPPRSPAPPFLRSMASFRPHGATLTNLFRCVLLLLLLLLLL